MLLYVCTLMTLTRTMGAKGPGRSGGKSRGLKRTWIVPGCLALCGVHLRWSVTHTIRNRKTHTHTHIAHRAGLLFSLSARHTCTHYSQLNLRTLIYRAVYLPFGDPVTASPGFLPPLPIPRPSSNTWRDTLWWGVSVEGWFSAALPQPPLRHLPQES